MAASLVRPIAVIAVVGMHPQTDPGLRGNTFMYKNAIHVIGFNDPELMRVNCHTLLSLCYCLAGCTVHTSILLPAQLSRIQAALRSLLILWRGFGELKVVRVSHLRFQIRFFTSDTSGFQKPRVKGLGWGPEHDELSEPAGSLDSGCVRGSDTPHGSDTARPIAQTYAQFFSGLGPRPPHEQASYGISIPFVRGDSVRGKQVLQQ